MVMQKILPMASDIPDQVAQYVAGSHPTIRQGLHTLPVPSEFLKGMDGEPFITETQQVIYTFNKPSVISGIEIYVSPSLVKGLVDRINAGTLYVESNTAKTERMANMDKETAINTVYTSVDISKVLYSIKGPAMAWVNADNTISLGASIKPNYSNADSKAYFDGCKAAQTDVIFGMLFAYQTHPKDSPVRALDLFGFTAHPLVHQGQYHVMPEKANEYEILPIPSYQQPVIHTDSEVDEMASVFNSKFTNNILLGNGHAKLQHQPNLRTLEDYGTFRNLQLSYNSVMQLLGEEVTKDVSNLMVRTGHFKEHLFRSEYIKIGSISLLKLIGLLKDRELYYTKGIDADKIGAHFALMEYVCAPDVVAQYRELYKPTAPLIDVES